MKPKNENTATPPPVKRPLFKISQNDSAWLWIVEDTFIDALTRAKTIWEKQGRDKPNSIKIERQGTVDYIPALKKPHWEF